MSTMSWYLALAGTFFLGLQTAISPCPLTTNIAAISYIGMRTGKTRTILLTGLFYAIGQIITYMGLAFLVLGFSLVSGDHLTRFFTATLHALIGPILIVIGMVLTGLIPLKLPEFRREWVQKSVERFGLGSAMPLGMLFALAFCPTTAAMFLAMLTLAAQAKSACLFPLVFGIGTALPVCLCAWLLAFQMQYLSRTFAVLGKIDAPLRNVTGSVFILAGLFLSVKAFT